MEIRIQRIFLKVLFTIFFASTSSNLFASDANNNDSEDSSNSEDVREPEQTRVENIKIFDPQIVRPEIDKDAIDTENWELGVNYGVISIEDFGSSNILSYNLAYHVTEDFFISLNYGKATAGQSSFEILTGVPLLEEPRTYIHYSIALGLNLLPGEGFIGENTAFTSNFIFLAGLGTTEFAGDNRSTLVFGGGYQILLNDWFSMNVSVKNNLYDIELTGSSKVANDLELSTGFTVFF